MRPADERPHAILRPLRNLRRYLSFLSALLLLLAGLGQLSLAQPAKAQSAVQLEVTPLFEGNYGRGKWLPLSIVLRNQGAALDVLLAASIPNSTFRNTLSVELANGAEKRVTLYAAMDDQTRELRVTVEQDGALLAEQQVAVRPRAGERMLGLVAQQPLRLSLPPREQLRELPLLAFELLPADLPDQASGLSSLALLLLNDIPSADLSAAQLRALWLWVANGGHLVIGGGPGATRTLEALPTELQVATLGADLQLDTAALSEFAGVSPPSGLVGIQLQPAADAQLLGRPEGPLWAKRRLGNGQITQLAFDPASAPIAGWAGAMDLWDRLLRPPLLINLPSGIETTPDYAREQILTSALGNLPPINLPNAGPLFAALALYTVLIGPGLALILRRLDRQAAGWVVLPLAAIVTGALALGLATTMQADQRIVSQISLVEQIGPDFARARTVAAVLSPQAGAFAVNAPSEALVRPLSGGSGAFVPVGAAQGDMVQQSGSFAIQAQAWQTEGLIAEQTLNFTALDAQLTVSEQAIQAVVNNTTGQQLRDVVIVYGEQSVRIGDLAAGQQGVATWPPPPGPGAERQPLGVSVSTLVLGAELAKAREPGERAERQILIREALLSAAVGRGLAEEESGPFVFAWLTNSPLPLEIAASGAARQQVALLVTRPRIAGAGRAFAPPGWLRPDLQADQRVACSGSRGRGVFASPAPITMTLSLPPAMASFRAEQITLFMESERPWPNAGVTTELFNWATEVWTPLSFDGPGDLSLANAGPYMRAGQLRLRLGGRIDEGGCLFIQGQALGELAGP